VNKNPAARISHSKEEDTNSFDGRDLYAVVFDLNKRRNAKVSDKFQEYRTIESKELLAFCVREPLQVE